MKVLLAGNEEYRLYSEAIANAIRTFRSHVEVALTNMSELEAAVERLDPQLVIVSGAAIPKNPVGEKLMGYVELSPEPDQPSNDQPSNFRVAERSWESTNPTLGEILSVIWEVEGLYGTSREPE
jgi:hypothetical protein